MEAAMASPGEPSPTERREDEQPHPVKDDPDAPGNSVDDLTSPEAVEPNEPA